MEDFWGGLSYEMLPHISEKSYETAEEAATRADNCRINRQDKPHPYPAVKSRQAGDMPDRFLHPGRISFKECSAKASSSISQPQAKGKFPCAHCGKNSNVKEYYYLLPQSIRQGVCAGETCFHSSYFNREANLCSFLSSGDPLCFVRR